MTIPHQVPGRKGLNRNILLGSLWHKGCVVAPRHLLPHFALSTNLSWGAVLLSHLFSTFIFHSRRDKEIRGSSLLLATPALTLQLCSPSEITISVPRMEGIPRGVFPLCPHEQAASSRGLVARGSSVSLVIKLGPDLLERELLETAEAGEPVPRPSAAWLPLQEAITLH